MAYVRKTKDEYRLHVNYGGNWEYEVNEPTHRLARQRQAEYHENCPEYPTKITGPHRVALTADDIAARDQKTEARERERDAMIRFLTRDNISMLGV